MTFIFSTNESLSTIEQLDAKKKFASSAKRFQSRIKLFTQKKLLEFQVN